MSDHEWCRDVRRDEAVRAAEDAAAVPSIQHRDLPEQVALLWASLGDIIGRVVRLEGEMDAGQDEEAAPAVCDSVPPANGLRTERVTPPWQRAKWDEALAIICDGGDWGRGNNFDHGVLGALVIWADKEMDRLAAERDAAIRERDEAREERALLLQAIGLATTAVPNMEVTADDPIGMMRRVAARVAELESAAKAAPAANAGGVSNPGDVSGDGKSNCQGTLDGSQEPVAWGVLMPNQDVRTVCLFRNTEEKAKENFPPSQGWTHFPLYSAPQPPRGWLTAEEREAVRWIIDFSRHHAVPSAAVAHCHIETANALLARETPPKVRRPNPNVVITTVDARERIDRQWIAAIRAAGGEVEG